MSKNLITIFRFSFFTIIICFFFFLHLIIVQDVNRTNSSISINSKPIKDNIYHEFATDESLLGKWISVDFVKDISDFKPNRQKYKGILMLESMVFLDNGDMKVNGDEIIPCYSWTKGLIIHENNYTASEYEYKEIDGVTYLFIQHKSGDYTFRGMEPYFYVLKAS